MKQRALLALVLAAASLQAAPNTLYKSVDANGVVMFSDVPPPAGARVIEERDVGTSAQAQENPGSPHITAPGNPVASLDQVYSLIDADEALAKANARVDQAERNLATARNGTASRFEGLRLVSRTDNANDHERVAFYEGDLKIARRELVDLLRARQTASTPPGSPYVVSVQPISSQLASRKIASR